MVRLASTLTLAGVHDYFDRFSELVHGDVHTKGWEQQLCLPERIGTGTISRLRIRPGMEIVISDLTFSQDMKLHVREACQLFELNYCLSGDIYCEWNGRERHTGGRAGNVCFLEDVEVYMEKKAGIRNVTLEIRMCPGELYRYAGDSADRHRIEALLERHKGSIDRCRDSAAIQRCAFELIHCAYKGAMKRLYMESKAMELIAWFARDEEEEVGGRSFALRPDDVDKLRAARELVLNHAEQPLSIKELALRVGINEFKLKKGFRTLFGTTVFELVRRERMEKALWLMESESLNVGETAVSLGYSNLSNFTTAFRKHYGCNPSEYLKRLYERSEQQNDG